MARIDQSSSAPLLRSELAAPEESELLFGALLGELLFGEVEDDPGLELLPEPEPVPVPGRLDPGDVAPGEVAPGEDAPGERLDPR